MRQQIGALTGLRFFAAIHVFMFHFGAGFAERSGAPRQIVTYLENGYLGVSIFFVLSGFILTYTYRPSVESLRMFAWARFARIYPVYLLALLIALPVARTRLDMVDAIKVLGMAQAWTPYSSESGYTWIMQAWTLSVELAFYICFPALLLLLQRLPRNTLFVGILLMSAIIVAGGTSSIAPGSARPDLPYWVQPIPLPLLRLPEFVLGMLICNVFLLKTHEHARHPRWKWDTSVAVTLGLIFLLLSTEKTEFHMLGLVTVLFGVLIYLLSIPNCVVSRMLASTPLQALGGASYAFYLLQDPTREWVRVIVPSASIGQFLNPLILTAISLAVFYGLEKRSRKIILSFARAIPRAPLPEFAPPR